MEFETVVPVFTKSKFTSLKPIEAVLEGNEMGIASCIFTVTDPAECESCPEVGIF